MSRVYRSENVYNSYVPGGAVGAERKTRKARTPEEGKPSELRDLQATVDSLKREIERKDSRSDALSKELTSIRAIAVSQSREIKIVRDTYDKLNQERQGLVAELGRRKDNEHKMEAQLARMENAHKVLACNQELRSENDRLKRECESSAAALDLKSDKVRALERDLEIMRRTFDVESKYESSKSGGEGLGAAVSDTGTNRDIMRSLYYELGKRQTDAHGMALSLADLQKRNNMIKETCEAQAKELEEAHEEIESLKAHVAQLLKQSVVDADEMGTLREAKLQADNFSHELTAQLEETSGRLAQLRITSEEEVRTSAAALEEKTSSLEVARKELKALRNQVEAMQLSLSHSESIQRISDRRNKEERENIVELRAELERERMDVVAAREDLSRSSGVLSSEREQFSVLQHRVALQSEELMVKERELREARLALQSREEGLESSRRAAKRSEEAHEEMVRVQGEREEALSTLERAMGMVRDLSAKLGAEKTKSVEVEARLEALRRSKEQVSSAVLDALHKERTKTARLQSRLEQLAGSTAVADLSTMSPSSSSPHASASTAGGGLSETSPSLSAPLPVPAPRPVTSQQPSLPSQELMRMRAELEKLSQEAVS